MAEIWYCMMCRKQTVKDINDGTAPKCVICGSKYYMVLERSTRIVDTKNFREENEKQT